MDARFFSSALIVAEHDSIFALWATAWSMVALRERNSLLMSRYPAAFLQETGVPSGSVTAHWPPWPEENAGRLFPLARLKDLADLTEAFFYGRRQCLRVFEVIFF